LLRDGKTIQEKPKNPVTRMPHSSAIECGSLNTGIGQAIDFQWFFKSVFFKKWNSRLICPVNDAWRAATWDVPVSG
jgi:hypothetical protein